MISDKITKQDFIIRELKHDLDNIYRTQLAIARENIYVKGASAKIQIRKGKRIGIRTGDLLKSLENPDYMIQTSGDGRFIISAGIVKHMRFIDMKKYGNREIYNKQVWGILYNNSLKNIRFNYGKEIAETVGDALRVAFPDEHGGIGNSFGEKYEKIKGK
ncbi:MAG: hypothetical protein LBO74_10475 [Candidatus Symbiothrix sp.]|jgi:hypothetical protein|nr:hypothetical protein [Candidatus Symbiothrix sp.]